MFKTNIERMTRAKSEVVYKISVKGNADVVPVQETHLYDSKQLVGIEDLADIME